MWTLSWWDNASKVKKATTFLTTSLAINVKRVRRMQRKRKSALMTWVRIRQLLDGWWPCYPFKINIMMSKEHQLIIKRRQNVCLIIKTKYGSPPAQSVTSSSQAITLTQISAFSPPSTPRLTQQLSVPSLPVGQHNQQHLLNTLLPTYLMTHHKLSFSIQGHLFLISWTNTIWITAVQLRSLWWYCSY